MAETVHLFLKANGQTIEGDSTQASLGREGSIECLAFDSAVSTARDAGSGMATGRRTYQPVLVRKRIDRSSPLLLKALTENQAVEATFRFYRPSASGDGTTEQFYTVHVGQARVASVRQYLPDTLGAETAALPPLEEVTFSVRAIDWTWTDGGVSHSDSLGGVR